MPTISHFLILLAVTVLSTSKADAEKLSPVDKQLLLESLEKIQNGSDQTVSSRFQVALKAFQAARTEKSATHSLFLKCIEKVRFEDNARKGSEFRNWKKRHRDSKDDQSFRHALQLQLKWLILRMEASKKPDNLHQLAPAGLEIVATILRESKHLAPHMDILSASALSSPFARAYEIGDLNTNGWPATPTDVSALYETIILPKLRKGKDFTALRTNWQRRLEAQGQLIEKFASEGSDNTKRKPAFENWQKDTYPTLKWTMEVDLFNAGDEQESARRMLAHLKKHLQHKSAPGWIKQFTSLVKGEPIQPTEDEK